MSNIPNRDDLIQVLQTVRPSELQGVPMNQWSNENHCRYEERLISFIYGMMVGSKITGKEIEGLKKQLTKSVKNK